jgi:dephospho-CoA kinase
VTGLPGAGKGEAVRILNEEKGIPVVRMGDVVWEWVENAGLPLEPSVVGPFANSEREKHGNEIWAVRCVEKVREVQTSDVMIDGVRTVKEIEVFRREFGENLVIVTVNSSREKRLERIMSRGRSDDSISQEDFKRRDERELGWGLGEVIQMAQYELENEGDLEELKKDVLKLYERIKG